MIPFYTCFGTQHLQKKWMNSFSGSGPSSFFVSKNQLEWAEMLNGLLHRNSSSLDPFYTILIATSLQNLWDRQKGGSSFGVDHSYKKKRAFWKLKEVGCSIWFPVWHFSDHMEVGSCSICSFLSRILYNNEKCLHFSINKLVEFILPRVHLIVHLFLTNASPRKVGRWSVN